MVRTKAVYKALFAPSPKSYNKFTSCIWRVWIKRDKELVNHRLDDASPGMAGKHIRALSDGLTTKGLHI